MSFNIHPKILKHIEQVESDAPKSCKDQKLLVKHIRKCFETEDIYTDFEQFENYLSLVKYWDYEQLFPWEEFIIGLHDCTYWRKTNMPRWPILFLMGGRGLGKDGLMAYESMCSLSPYCGIKNYDVDICANNEDQAMTPVKDFWNVLEDPDNTKKLKKFFYWTKEQIASCKHGGIMRGRTNSPKGKDGLRSGRVMFNEIHQYENYDNINVFTTGLGKKKHPRRGYYTTQGDVREGPLDDLLEDAKRILEGGEPDNGFLPVIFRLDNKKDVHHETNWTKANPSLPYRPDLLEEIRQEYREWVANPNRLPAFMTKRMNLPESANATPVTAYENIKATNQPFPNMEGWQCVVGIDYASITDFASVNYHFRNGKQRFDINHSWLCLQSKDLSRIKAPWKDWANKGYITLVDEPQINPDLIAEDIQKVMLQHNVCKIGIDNNRFALVAESLKKIGIDPYDKDKVKIIRPNDIMAIVPVIESYFIDNLFTWGDNPVLRWATNNVKVENRKARTNVDTGNRYYSKIEAKSRKTDAFMAFVHSMIVEDALPESIIQIPQDIFTVVF